MNKARFSRLLFKIKEKSAIKVLFLAANTDESAWLQLDEEFTRIKRFLEVTPEWDAIQLLHEPKAASDQLPQLLIREKPDIIHFAGHADADGSIITHGPAQRTSRVDPVALYDLLKAVHTDVTLLVFSTCYGESAAAKAIELVPFCIGTEDTVSDAVAVQFSALFYQGLGFGRTIEDAYKYAKAGVAVALGSIPANKQPQFKQNPNARSNRVRLRSPVADDLKRLWVRRLVVGILLATFGSISLAILLFPFFGWLSPRVAEVRNESLTALRDSRTYLMAEVDYLGGDTEPPKSYPLKDINLTTLASWQELMIPAILAPSNQKERDLQTMDDWRSDLLLFARGSREELLVIRSDPSFKPPYKSCHYTLTVSSQFRINRVAAFLVRDNGGDTTYRPQYRQMAFQCTYQRDVMGTLFLDRPRNGESLLIYLWLSLPPGAGQEESINQREGRTFSATLTDMVQQ